MKRQQALDNAVAISGSQGNFELNATRPILINSEDSGTLKQATLALGYLDGDTFDRIADPATMTGSGA